MPIQYVCDPAEPVAVRRRVEFYVHGQWVEYVCTQEELAFKFKRGIIFRMTDVMSDGTDRPVEHPYGSGYRVMVCEADGFLDETTAGVQCSNVPQAQRLGFYVPPELMVTPCQN